MDYKYDIFISYTNKNRDSFLDLKHRFNANGLTVFDMTDLPLSQDYYESISNAIMNSEYFLILLSPELCSSESVLHEIAFAVTESQKNGMKIIPVALNELLGDTDSYSVLGKSEILMYYIGRQQILNDTADGVINRISAQIKKEKSIKQLYKDADRSYQYGAYNHACELFLTLADSVEDEAKLNCYDRAALCCEKTGHTEKAKRLYKLSENEHAIERLSTVTVSSGETNQETPSDLDLLHKIANYCDASIDLFSELLKNNQSPEGINCLKTSCYRLLNYCKTIGGFDDVISSALDKIKETETQFSNKAPSTESTDFDVIKTYRTYLGLEFPESDNYDVFISYKSEDEMLARRVYDYLLSAGKRVFFACEVLPDLGKTEYRDAIMDALDHSQHLVLVTSKLDYITSNWVKEEWSFFASKLIEDDHKGNIALIVHDDFKVEKKLLPPNLRYKQRFLMSNFKNSLLKFLQQ